MAVQTNYYAGGFQVGAPAKNRREEWDGSANTYTTWDAAGAQTSQRALTGAEVATLAAQDATALAATNTDTIRSRAATALTVNATFLALGNPTNAQAVTQVQALTRQCNGLIRLLLNQLASITDT